MRRLDFRLRCDVDCQMDVVLNLVVSQVIGLHYAPLVSAEAPMANQNTQ
jgi:hypothetical protein